MSSHSHCVSFTVTLNQTKSRLWWWPSTEPRVTVAHFTQIRSDTQPVWAHRGAGDMVTSRPWPSGDRRQMPSHWPRDPPWSPGKTDGKSNTGCWVAPIPRWAKGNDTLWFELEHGQWSHSALSGHNEGYVRCVGDQASFRPRAIQTQRYSVRKPGIILIRATFHVARKGMTDWWQCFRIFPLDLE